MNWVDLVILTVIVVFALEGIGRGFFVQLAEIIGFLVSLIVALTFYPWAAQLAVKYFSLPKIAASPLGFLSIWLIAQTLYSGIFSYIIRKIPFKIWEKPLDKYLGFIPAAVNALLFSAFILLFVVALPIRPDIKKDIFNSKVGSVLIDQAGILEKPISSIFGPFARQSLTFLTVTPQEKGLVDLQFTQKEYTVDATSEKQMFEQVNQERTKFGVKPLAWNESFAQIGRNHSKDMFEGGYFSHYSKEGKDVGNRLDESGIVYTYAGENLALAPDVTRAHTGLMDSPGHRRNILDPAFGQIGIGAIDGGIYGKMFTQIFTN